MSITNIPEGFVGISELTDASQNESTSQRLDEGMTYEPVPDVPEIEKGEVFIDPTYGTEITRVTDHETDDLSGYYARNYYSRIQAFNADESKLVVSVQGGSWHLYDPETSTHIKQLDGPTGAAEVQWDPSDPDIIYYVGRNGVGNKFYQLDVETDEITQLADFTDRTPWDNVFTTRTRYEGSPSEDGSLWAFMTQDSDWNGIGMMVWDKENDEILSTFDFAEHGITHTPDHVSMSPSGEYVVVSWDHAAGLGTRAYTLDFSDFVQLHHGTSHSDLVKMPNGNDAYVSVDYQSNDGEVYFIELQTGERTTLFDNYVNGTSTAMHFSGRAFDKPGWVLVSTYAERGSSDEWLHQKIFAVELNATPRILDIAHHQVEFNGYWTEPHASVNKDFTKIVFNSNWGNDSSTDVDTYMVRLEDTDIPDWRPATEVPSDDTPGNGDDDNSGNGDDTPVGDRPPADDHGLVGREQLVEGMDNSPVPQVEEFAAGEAILDPTYGTVIRRITDHDVDDPSGFARNYYSRIQAFNSDESKMVVAAQDGYWHLYDPETTQHIAKLKGPAGAAEVQWDPVDPNVIYYVGTNGVGNKFYEMNVETGETTELADFTDRTPWDNLFSTRTRYEGSPSEDGNLWAFMTQDSDWGGLGVMVWDKSEDRILSTFDFASQGIVHTPDHVSMSPSGDYVVVSWGHESDLGTRAYTKDFSDFVQLHHGTSHSDLVKLANGNDGYVSVDYQSNDGEVYFVDIHTGEKTVLFDNYINGTSTAMHFSGRAYDKPGWVLMSTYAERGGSDEWLHQKIFAVELKEDPAILNLAHTQVSFDGYWTEPHASVNKDFTKVVFNSNWGNGSDTDIDTYMIELTEDNIPDFGADPVDDAPIVDLIEGTSGSDELFGGADDERIEAGDGNDWVFNGLGNDTVDGGAGDDRMWGGRGDDQLTGGEGEDRFAFASNSGHDVITDFNLSEDTLVLSELGFANLGEVLTVASDTEDGMVLNISEDMTISVTGMKVADITDDTVAI